MDFLTISPSLLEELKNDTSPVPKKLNSQAGEQRLYLESYFTFQYFSANQPTVSAAQGQPLAKVTFVDSEPEFRWALLEDQMAFDKLHEGIRKFAEDGTTLQNLLKQKITA